MVVITMELHKTTPNKYRYKAVDEDAVLGDVYILKGAFAKKPPKAICVTIRDLH